MTSFSNKCAILSELWMNHRKDPGFQDFIEYNDLGLPLAYVVAEGLATPNDLAEKFIEETYDIFIESLGIVDNNFNELDELLMLAQGGKVE